MIDQQTREAVRQMHLKGTSIRQIARILDISSKECKKNHQRHIRGATGQIIPVRSSSGVDQNGFHPMPRQCIAGPGSAHRKLRS